MDYHNNLQLSMNYLLKYETYRIIKLYAYIFIIFAVSYFMEFNFGSLLGLSQIIFPTFLSLPLVYCFFLFFVIKSKSEEYQFKLTLKCLVISLVIIAIFALLPSILVILQNKDSYFIELNRALISVTIILIFTFVFLRNFSSTSKNYIFLIFGIIYSICWVLETVLSVYTYTWLLFILSGIIFYLYSRVFLKRDLH